MYETAVGVTTGLTVLVLSWALTGWVRRYATARSLLALPTDRGLHNVPTPVGGGVAIAVTVLLAVVVAGLMGWIPRNEAVALLTGGAAIAAIGFADDWVDVAPIWRLIVQLSGAAFAVYLLGGMPSLLIGGTTVHLGGAGAVIAAMGIVWLTNLYNFMDGIDGIAAGEAVLVGLASAALLLMRVHGGGAFVTLSIALAALGFLLWNWPPAKIFMGDTGSSLLGYLFGVLAVATERSGSLPIYIWILLLGVFVFDSTVTLVRRVLRGERWYAPHRNHAYQRAVQAGWTHGQVTGSVLVVGTLLALIALTTLSRPSWTSAALAVSGLFLGALYMRVETKRPMTPPERSA